jgi:hypothetical protein
MLEKTKIALDELKLNISKKNEKIDSAFKKLVGERPRLFSDQ